MCRYYKHSASIRYKCKFVCLDCRYCKKSFHQDLQKCVHCDKLMHDIGLDYRPPRKTNDSGWRELSKLVKADVGFHSCGCEGPSLKAPPKPTDSGFYTMYDKDGKYVKR